MSQSTLQNNQNNPTFTELQSAVIQPGQSSNINYSDVNVDFSENSFPANTDLLPTSNEYTASTSTPIVSSYAPQYVEPQQPIENIPSPLNSFNMTIYPSQSDILSFDIPGFKIIVIPTFSQQENTYLNYSSSNITNTQFQQ
ncbi:hypothetical protein RhiirC2_718622 [Rhizophagus irregularis]|uniref:Uncharacterized protein n=1 Tax=Rhizophagus irregularis TaxID=588596 RepID=A0A2N1MHR1_9GLOM|nr:hypothetical protein RhiirC2_718622 [Rhizophagus irregularis]